MAPLARWGPQSLLVAAALVPHSRGVDGTLEATAAGGSPVVDQGERVESAPQGFSLTKLTAVNLRELHGRISKVVGVFGSLKPAHLIEFQTGVTRALQREGADKLFASLDNNGDGRLSWKDLEGDWGKGGDGRLFLKLLFASLPDPRLGRGVSDLLYTDEQEFKLADEDGDGLLNVREFRHLIDPKGHKDLLKHKASEHHDKMDEDGKKGIDLEEFVERQKSMGGTETGGLKEAQDMFKHLDKNADGSLDPQELEAYVSGDVHRHLAIAEVMEVVDKDGDGEISVDELAGAAKRIMASDSRAWEVLHDFLSHPAKGEL